MSKQQTQRVSLEEVASGRLPERILKQIEKMDLTVEEVVEWEKSKPNFRFILTDKQLDFMVRKRIRWSSKWAKIVSFVGPLVGIATWIFFQYVLPHLTT